MCNDSLALNLAPTLQNNTQKTNYEWYWFIYLQRAGFGKITSGAPLSLCSKMFKYQKKQMLCIQKVELFL